MSHPITQVKGIHALKKKKSGCYKTLKRPTEPGDGEDIEACKQSESRLRFHPCRGNKPRETSQSSPVNKTRAGASEAFRTLPLSSPPWILPDNSQQQTSGNKVILPSQMIGSLQREPASYPQYPIEPNTDFLTTSALYGRMCHILHTCALNSVSLSARRYACWPCSSMQLRD